MTKRSWVRQLFACPAARPIRKAAARCRPHLEVLEDRLAPAAYHVTSLLDDGSAGTLRDAITRANANPGPDTIDFRVTGSISLNGSQLPAFTDAATTAITGPSGGVTLDAHGASRIFEVNAGAAVGLDRLTLANGSALDGGAGIWNAGTLSLTNCTLSGNTAAFAGDFLPTVVGGNGGGIRNDGTLSLTDCTLSGNTAIDGGGIWNDGALSLTNVTLSGNTAAYSIVLVGPVDAAIVGGNGGGVGNAGTLSLTNCTLSGNTALYGGGIGNAGTLSLTNCTLSGNSAVGHPFFGGGFGGGIYNAADLTLNNSIVANSPAGGDISGGYSGGHNLFGSVELGPLADNGGPTQTMALPAGSPAIDAGDDSLAPAADQRGFARDAAPDIGAFEVGHHFVVTTLADEEGGIGPSLGAGTSLREAIAFADKNPGADTITFAVSGTISLNGSQLPTITDDLTVAGPAAALTIDAHGASRIFEVNAGAAVGLDRLTLANGSALDGGAGIWNDGTLSLTNCTLSGNTAAFAGDFLPTVVGGNGGGIRNDGTLSLTDCTLSGNTAIDGGGIWNDGALSLTNVTLSGNTAAYSIVLVGPVDAAIVGGNGGGVGNAGTLSLTNCTLSGNTALYGGGIGNAGTLSLTNCTLSGNSAVGHPFFGGGFGGGIYNAADLTLNNSIVANSPAGGDISGGYSGGHNLFGSVELGALADNGGPTQTMALPAGSPAINAGDAALAPAADQRGFARDAAPDIGAFEAQVPTLTRSLAAVTVNEGSPATNTGTFDDADGRGTVTLTASLGTVAGDTAAGTWSWSYTPPDGPSGMTTVTITATDSSGLEATSTFTLTVNNVAPTAAVSGPSDGVRGQARTFTLLATDPSSVDQAAGFTFAITWGDGTTQTVSGPSGTTVSHVYTASGTYAVKVTATDKNGGTSAAATVTDTITAVALETDPTDPSKTALFVGGTTAADTITIKPADANGTLNVKIGATSLGNFKPTGHIIVYGQAGDDTIKLQTASISGKTVSVTAPAFLFGGDGKDTLDASGSAANNVLQGGAGNDTLKAGSGRDLLVGGLGADVLQGNAGDDILIGGTTDYDSNVAALDAVMAEWGRTDADYSTRVKHLSGTLSGGLNSGLLLTASTVHDDAASDQLAGGAGLDWFFALLSGTTKDTVKDKAVGEVVTAL